MSTMVRRVFIEKKEGFDMEARRLKENLAGFLGEKFPELKELKSLRILRRYDADNLDKDQFKQLTQAVFSEPQTDRIFYGTKFTIKEKNISFFGIEYLPGQYNQRADSAEQCAELVTGIKPRIRTADIYVFEGSHTPLSGAALEGIKKYLINPVDSREASLELPLTFDDETSEPADVEILTGFIKTDGTGLKGLSTRYGLSMSIDDLLFCRDWFAKEGRDPTLAELRILDTYWSDHCRHSTFNTVLEEIAVSGDNYGLKKALELYEETRREVYGAAAQDRKRSLMDMATLGVKALKKRGLVNDLDESPEINACTVKVKAEFPNGVSEPWLLLFKNETHNHPTEIESFGGAATCLGGAIRDPLSGRAYVHQAMRVTGGGDPRGGLRDTLPGKLPQIKIALEAAAGYSSYGNQIGLATGQVNEFYHSGFLAKRMELGAVIGAVPEAWVRREEPVAGDLVILVGGRTGRDGIGGATGSSKVHTGESVESAGAEVQKGNAVEERKLQRLFRKSEVSRMIKRCNDFGAGGVSVAVGELAGGLDINLDAVTKKYAGLNGTELAISESQERMAVLCSSGDAEAFIKAAVAENLEAVVIAKVTSENRLRMNWRGKTIVDISRDFLDTNGASRTAKALLPKTSSENTNHGRTQLRTEGKKNVEYSNTDLPAGILLDNLERELVSLRSGSRRGLQERFDGSIGANSVLFPWGGSEQGTPECGMAAMLPSLGKQSRTTSLMTFGYDPDLMSIDPYSGAKGSIREALAKFACLGGDPFTARLSLQEYFQRPETPETWGTPAAALLGALEAQLRLGVPAIGGKDSMSGNYRDDSHNIDLAVPPTLVAFAAGTVAAEKVRSGTLSGKGGNAVVLLSQSPLTLADKEGRKTSEDEWELFKTNMKTLEALAAQEALMAAYPVGPGGIAASLALMAFGNMAGVEAYAASFYQVDSENYQGSMLAEINEAALPSVWEANWVLAARTLTEPVFRIVVKKPAEENNDEVNPEALAAETPLEVLRRAYEYPLAQVYPQTSTGTTVAEPADESMILKLPAFSGGVASSIEACKHSRLPLEGAPLVTLPVFPGTNCEWDMERVFREAGARTQLVIFRNRNHQDIAKSLKELATAFSEAQIIAFSGGFSAGDEPDGSGKFIANVLRSPIITAAVSEFLEKRGGLMLGICNGFQAFIKTGLVPYGRIIPSMDAVETASTLTFNAIGRHISRMVRTRVMPNISPWLSLEEPGKIHIIPVSHGEGRVAIQSEEAESLFAAGQVPFCYANADGKATMAEPDNPNGSAFAIEGLTSPDGRILGKMAHSERCGEFVHINIPGNKRQRIFEAGVRYFK
jgi:phosphoribosylformylglycinamidine synthase